MNVTESTDTTSRSPGRRRAIGPLGTIARFVGGGAMVATVVVGHATGTFQPLPWLVGLVVLPAIAVAAQAFRARRDLPPLRMTGPLSAVLTLAVFLALWLTPYYAPALWATSDAALLFFGGSMLLASLRGYAGCEILAVSNWLLRRDDQVGCIVYSPIDRLEQAMARPRRTHPT